MVIKFEVWSPRDEVVKGLERVGGWDVKALDLIIEAAAEVAEAMAVAAKGSGWL